MLNHRVGIEHEQQAAAVLTANSVDDASVARVVPGVVHDCDAAVVGRSRAGDDQRHDCQEAGDGELGAQADPDNAMREHLSLSFSLSG